MTTFAQRYPAYMTRETAAACVAKSKARRVRSLTERYALELRDRLRPTHLPMEQAADRNELRGLPSCFGAL
jgi:hypothetical protein